MNKLEIMEKVKQNAYHVEREIISVISSENKKSDILISEGNPEHFLNENTKRLYEILREAKINGTPYRSVVAGFGLSTLYAECVMMESFTLDPSRALEKQKDLWLQLQALKTMSRNEHNTFDNPRIDISNLMGELSDAVNGHEGEDVTISGVTKEYEAEALLFAEKILEGKEIIGHSMGYAKLDELADGLRDHLWVIGAYTSAGKTFFSLNIVANLLKQGIPVAFYSLEMSKVDVYGRILGILSGVNSRKMIRGSLSTEELEKVKQAKELVTKSGLRIHGAKEQYDDIVMSMGMEKLTGKAEVFVIDYAQLVRSGDLRDYEALSRLSKGLQTFCRQKKAPVILLSQVSNEHAKSPESGIIGFKGAGEMAASADLAIEMIGTDDKETKERKIVHGEPLNVKLCIKKNRHGRIRNIEMEFNPTNGQFTER
jgi:hypothetical protein